MGIHSVSRVNSFLCIPKFRVLKFYLCVEVIQWVSFCVRVSKLLMLIVRFLELNLLHIFLQEEEGTWGENFKSHHDSKKRGNEAVSMDFSFPDADQVYGKSWYCIYLRICAIVAGLQSNTIVTYY